MTQYIFDLYGTLIDTTDGTGSVAAENLWFNGHNNGGYMPLKDGSCYRLFATILDNRGVQVNPNNPYQIKAGFTVRFNTVDAYNLLINAVKDGSITTTAIFEEQGTTDTAAFSAAKIASHLEKCRDQLAAGSVVKNTITGTLTLEVNSAELFAELHSETGVIIASQTLTYTV
jgi:hypothetical protein